MKAHLLGQVLLLSIFYFPLLRNLTGSSSVSQMILNAVLAPASLVVLVLLVPRTRGAFLATPALVMLLMAWVVAILSMHYEASMGRTMSDAGRLVLASCFLASGYHLASTARLRESWVSKQLLWYAASGIIFSCLVLFSWAWPVLDFYKGRLSDDPLPFHFFRASGFSGYPTDFGCFLVLILLLVRAQWRRKEIGLGTAILFGAVSIGGIAGSSARGAVIQLVGLAAILGIGWLMKRVGTVAWLRRSFSYGWLAFIVMSLFALGAGLFFAHSSGKLATAGERFKAIGYVTEALAQPDESVLHRFLELKVARDVAFGDRPVPRGAEREEVFGLQVIEGYWAHYTTRYGLLGALIGVVLALVLIRMAYIARGHALGEALLYWLVSFYLFVAPFSDVMARSRGIAVYFTLLGLVAGWRYSQRIVPQESAC